MKLLKNKFVLLSPILVLAVVVIFSLTMIPSVNPKPENLPIALVNQDQGTVLPDQSKLNMGKTITDQIRKKAKPASGKKPAVEWISVKDRKEAEKGMDDRKYYAALVIPQDFSEKQASLQTPNPSSSEVGILINQGMNTMASTAASQMLNGMIDLINDNMRTQVLSGIEKKGGTLSTKQAAVLASPIKKVVTEVHATGSHSANGNAPIALFQPLWMASIAGAAIVSIILNKINFSNRAQKFANLLVQVLIGAVLAIIAGFGLTWMADSLGLNIPDFTNIALFLSVAFLSFFLMISAVLSWLGMKGLPLFVITLFFGAPLLSMAPEFMSAFYRDWIYSWLPMRFMVDGLREIFFFGKGLSWDHPTVVLTGIGLVSLLIFAASSLKLKKNTMDSAQID